MGHKPAAVPNIQTVSRATAGVFLFLVESLLLTQKKLDGGSKLPEPQKLSDRVGEAMLSRIGGIHLDLGEAKDVL